MKISAERFTNGLVVISWRKQHQAVTNAPRKNDYTAPEERHLEERHTIGTCRARKREERRCQTYMLCRLGLTT